MMMKLRHAVALVSGGVESFALVQLLLARGFTVWPLYVRCGLRWEPAEGYWLRRWLSAIRRPRLKPLAVADVPLGEVYRGHWSVTGQRVPSAQSPDAAVYLPGRNLLLLSHAAVYAVRRGASRVALGTLAGNPFADATPKFFAHVGKCAGEALGQPVRVLAPLRTVSKTSVIRRTRARSLALTFSCINPRGRRHCGRCNKCAERQGAFRQARVLDPTTYAA